jgi:hypothetical protein
VKTLIIIQEMIQMETTGILSLIPMEVKVMLNMILVNVVQLMKMMMVNVVRKMKLGGLLKKDVIQTLLEKSGDGIQEKIS